MTKEHAIRVAISGLSGPPRLRWMEFYLRNPDQLKFGVWMRLRHLQKKEKKV